MVELPGLGVLHIGDAEHLRRRKERTSMTGTTSTTNTAEANSVLTVLLAEEDDDVRLQLSESLSREGYHVVAVEDGLELFDYLAIAESSKGHLHSPDVIVSDVQLAGCGGLSACRRVRDGHLDTPFVLLAPKGDLETYVRAVGLGVSDVVEKPVDFNELREALSLLL